MAPKPIYKYTCIGDNLRSSIKESYLWFSTTEFLNDPFDLNYRLSDEYMQGILGQAASEMMNDLRVKVGDDHLHAVGNMADSLLRNEWFIEYSRDFFLQQIPYSVCCFTGREDNLLMWAHYTNNHKGVCLIYDLEESPDLYQYLHPVKYDSVLPIAEDMDEALFKAVLTKSPDWAYEEEWRILYLMHKGKVPINRKSLKGIIFGCRTPGEDVADLMKFCKDEGYNDLDFYRMAKSKIEFKLEKIKIGVTPDPAKV